MAARELWLRGNDAGLLEILFAIKCLLVNVFAVNGAAATRVVARARNSWIHGSDVGVVFFRVVFLEAMEAARRVGGDGNRAGIFEALSRTLGDGLEHVSRHICRG